jgi:hypothetical protein
MERFRKMDIFLHNSNRKTESLLSFSNRTMEIFPVVSRKK